MRLLATVARTPDVPLRAAAARFPDVRAWVASWAREAVPFGVLAVTALGLRLVQLGEKPYHHDESLHAWFSWLLVTGEGYSYDPVYHGPVQFYLIALANLVFGVGDYVGRIPVAVVGSLAVFVPFFLRRQLGVAGALTASALLCLSPSFLYFSRFAREDTHVMTATLAMIVVLLRFLDAPRRWHPPALLGLLAVAFAAKETTYIAVFVVGLFLAVAVTVQAVEARGAGRRLREARLVTAARSLGLDAWAWGISTFLVVFTLLFSTFLTNPEGLRTGLWGSIDYWLSQQPVNRGGQPWFYYLVLIPAYEWPIVILGLAGAVAVLRRPTLPGAFLVWTFAGTLAVYSWASERMPWLVIHSLLPLVLLAGVGAQALWRARGRLPAQIVLGLAVVAALGATASSLRLSYFGSADPRELLVQVQSADDVPRVRDELVRIQTAVTRATGEPLVLTVDSWGGTGWPWAWYLRDLPVGYYDLSAPEDVEPGPVVLVADPNHDVMRPRLDGYVGRRFTLRVWWVPEWGSAGPLDWARWAVTRRAWSPTATMDEWVYVRADVARLVRPPGRTG